MSTSGRKSDYLILAALGIVSVGCILAMTALGWFGEDDQGPGIRSSSSTNVEGTMACYVLQQRLGGLVRLSYDPLLEEALDEIDVLFLIDPIIAVHDGELRAVRPWVQNGGVLVCTDAAPELLEHLEAAGLSAGPGWTHFGGALLREGIPSEIPPGRLNLPLARDLETLQFSTTRTLTVGDSGPADAPTAAEPLLADEAGVRIAARRLGAGAVIVLADSSFLANGLIGKADNAILAANLVAYSLANARGNRVAFDEYHFGYGSGESAWTLMGGMLLKTSPGWAILSVTAAALCFLIYKGRRFGTRRAPQRTRRRSKLEYVHSVAATYRAAGANRLALWLIFHWFKGRCASHVGLPERAASGEIAARLAQRTGRSKSRYESVFARCEQATGVERLSARHFSSLLGGLAEIESEIADGSPTRT